MGAGLGSFTAGESPYLMTVQAQSQAGRLAWQRTCLEEVREDFK